MQVSEGVWREQSFIIKNVEMSLSSRCEAGWEVLAPVDSDMLVDVPPLKRPTSRPPLAGAARHTTEIKKLTNIKQEIRNEMFGYFNSLHVSAIAVLGIFKPPRTKCSF